MGFFRLFGADKEDVGAGSLNLGIFAFEAAGKRFCGGIFRKSEKNFKKNKIFLIFYVCMIVFCSINCVVYIIKDFVISGLLRQFYRLIGPAGAGCYEYLWSGRFFARPLLV